jgi:hypothetical protein
VTDQPNSHAATAGDPHSAQPNAQHSKQQSEKNNELISRYVAAVRRRLAAKEAGDITAELREAVASKLEAKEATLGRPANKEEMAALLRSFGSPMLAAARYKGRQYLIGPDLYPYYWPTARIVVGIVAAVAMVGFLVQGVLSDHPLRLAFQGIAAAWNGALFAFGVVTVIFIVLEQTKAGPKIEESWRPEQLPRDTQDKPKSLFESLFSLAWDALFIAWWVGLLHIPNTLPGAPGEAGMALDLNTEAWSEAYAPVLVMAVMQAVIHVADVLHPVWSRLRSLGAIAVNLVSLGVVWMLARHGQLFAVHGPASAADRVAKLNDVFLSISHVIVYGLAIGLAIALVVEIWRLARSFNLRAPPALA